MRAVETQAWVFDVAGGAQSDLAILTPPSDQYFSIVAATVDAANSNSVDVAVKIGFATTTLPTVTPNSATGAPGIFFLHNGIAKGGGWSQPGNGAVGAVGQPIRITYSIPTGGSICVIISFQRGFPNA